MQIKQELEIQESHEKGGNSLMEKGNGESNDEGNAPIVNQVGGVETVSPDNSGNSSRIDSPKELKSPDVDAEKSKEISASMIQQNGSGQIVPGTPLVIPQPYLHFLQQTMLLQQHQQMLNAVDVTARLAEQADEANQLGGMAFPERERPRGKSTTETGETTADTASDDSMEFDDNLFTDEELEDMMKKKGDGRIRHSGVCNLCVLGPYGGSRTPASMLVGRLTLCVDQLDTMCHQLIVGHCSCCWPLVCLVQTMAIPV